MMKQLISIMLIILLAFSAVSAVLADAPEFVAIGDQIFYEGETNVLAQEDIIDPDGLELRAELVEDSYSSYGSTYDESTMFSFSGDPAAGYNMDLTWNPGYKDIGDHTFTLLIGDADGEESSETFTITVVSQYVLDVEDYESQYEDLLSELEAQIVLYEDAIADDDEEDLIEVSEAISIIYEDIQDFAVNFKTTYELIDEAEDAGEIDGETATDLQDRIEVLYDKSVEMIETISLMQAYINNNSPEFMVLMDSTFEVYEGTPWMMSFFAIDLDDAEDTLDVTAQETSYTSISSSLDLTDSATFYEGSFDGEVIIEWTPGNDDVGEHYVTLTAVDSFGVEATMEIIIDVLNVNDAPTLEDIPDQTVAINTETSVAQTLSYQLEVEDIDGDSLTYNVQMMGVPTGDPADLPFPINNPQVDSDDVFTWTPDVSEVGRVFETHIIVEDSMGGISEEIIFDITVTTETAPSIDAIADQTVTVGDTLDLTVTATDASAITLEASGLSSDASFVDNGDGTADLSWTPTSEDLGESTITITATDADAEVSTLSFTITVEAVVGAPSIDSVADQSVIAGEELEFTIDATDAEGNEITFSTEGLDSDAATSETSGDSGSDTLTITWTPTSSDVGEHEVTVTATDSEENTASTTFIITVTEGLSEWEQAIVDLENEFADIEDTYNDDDLEDNYNDAVDDEDEGDIEDAEDDLNDVLDDLENLMDDIDDLRNDINDAQDDGDISSSEESDLEDQLDDLENDVQDLIDEIEDLLGIGSDSSLDGESATEYEESSSSSSTSSESSNSDIEVDTTILDGESTSKTSTSTVESTSSFDEIRPLLWLGAGIFIVLALLIFGLSLLLTKK